MKRSLSASSRGIALTVAVGLLLAAHSAWASHSPLDLLHSLSHDFLRHSPHGYLGVDVENATGGGAEVVAIDHDAPAGKVGLKVHDVLLQMNGQPIESSDQFRHILRRQPPGSTVTFAVGRDGSTIHVTVKLADRMVLERQAWSHHYSVPDPTVNPPGDEVQSFAASSSPAGSYFLGSSGRSNPLYVGVDVSVIGPQLSDYFGVTGGTGLLVENVDSQSPASRAGLRAGDVILKVNAVPMASRSDWQRAIRSNRGKPVDLTIVRNRQEQTLTMPAGISEGGS